MEPMSLFLSPAQTVASYAQSGADKTRRSAPSLLLLEARRGGRPGLAVEPPLALETPAGQAELDAIYFRTQEEPK